MKVVFVAAGPRSWGSSRMRAYWVAEAMRKNGVDAQVVQMGDAIGAVPEANVYIWQKTADLEFIAARPDARHYWDVCDPSWWWEPERCRKIAMRVDGAVCSNEALALDFYKEMAVAVHTIPDRLNLKHFQARRHFYQNDQTVRFVWFGVAVNRVAIFGGLANLERLATNSTHNISLTIVDDRPDAPFTASNVFPIYHTRWTLDQEVEIIASHDVAFLPPYPGAWGRVKSDNKKRTAVACGLPVWDGQDLREGSRLTSARQRETTVMETDTSDYDVSLSAEEWLKILH